MWAVHGRETGSSAGGGVGVEEMLLVHGKLGSAAGRTAEHTAGCWSPRDASAKKLDMAQGLSLLSGEEQNWNGVELLSDT